MLCGPNNQLIKGQKKLCGSAWQSKCTIYFKTFQTLDHSYKWCPNMSKNKPWCKDKTQILFFWQWAAKFDIWLHMSSTGRQHCHRWSVFTNSVWKQLEESNSPLSRHARLSLPDKCNNRVTPPTLLLCWVVPFTCLWKGPFWSLAKSRLAAHHPGMITLSDEKTQEDDTGVMGWKSACRRAKTHFLMHNKAFILLAVTRKVFVREGASWS